MLSYSQFIDRLRNEGAIIIKQDQYHEVLTINGMIVINWFPTGYPDKMPQFRKGRHWREFGEDLVATMMLPGAWYRRIRQVWQDFGNESAFVKHIGFSRGGGIAAFFGGTAYGAFLVPGLPVHKDATFMPVYDWFHGYALPVVNKPISRIIGARNRRTNPALAKFGPRR